jgi:glycosyltransferase involved in cell wall biosynthesis
MRVLVMTAMYPTEDNPAWGSFVRTQVEAVRNAGVEIELLVLDNPRRKLNYPLGLVELRHRLARGNIDLVHAHYGYVGVVAATQRRVPVVVTFHGDDLLGTVRPDGSLTRLSAASTRLCRAVGRRVDAAIVQSVAMAETLGSPQVHVISHEVDLETFQPIERGQARRALGLDPERRYALFAASPAIPVKRYPLAAAVVDEVRRRGCELELLVVHREPQQRLALYMSAADALLFPSFQEGSPNIVKQALACNLPIVATDVGDVRELLSGVSHCFVCDAAADALAAPLEQLLLDQPRTRGRERVERLSPELVAARIRALYADVLQRRAPVSQAQETTA